MFGIVDVICFAVVGFIAGGVFGMTMMAMCAVASRSDVEVPDDKAD